MERIQIISNHILPIEQHDDHNQQQQQQILLINNTTDALMELEEEHEKEESLRKIQCEKNGIEYIYKPLTIDFDDNNNRNKQN
ncbi:hypothetical protein RB653_008532 [Dictyostelium firmibasis]|uniref:Uncharacterized protein n=1 Tax=Dictyostelium firmibasis TaxID=79012 RepID=A0AAN7YWN5_9MYCE